MTGCAVVDGFGSRVYDHNLTSQDVMNKEILVNIVRASRYEPLNFMVITQVNGSQSETLNTGLPTITFGPALTAAQHQFPISNSVSSGVSGNYQSNPLVSSQFQQGMISPVTPRTAASLLANHDRETVLHLIVDSINVTSGKTTVRYANDPENDGEGCSVDSASDMLADSKRALNFLLDEKQCHYSKFVSFLKRGMEWGVSAELVPASASSKGSADDGAPASGSANARGRGDNPASSSPQATGRICWDPGLAYKEYKPFVRQYLKTICGENLGGKDKNGNGKDDLLFPFGVLGALRIELKLRSPSAIFVALGRMYHGKSAERVTPLLDPSVRAFGHEPLLTITPEAAADCYVMARYEGQVYCVPQNARRTALVMNILQELKNLAITPTDLNSAFSVRVLN